MTKNIILVFFALIILLPKGVSWAKHKETGPGSAADGILFSRHNLNRIPPGGRGRNPDSNPNAPTNGSISGYLEVCNYCHPPHFDIGPNSIPLWVSDTPSSYKAYGTTIAGTFVAGASGSSLACLACHDGVTTSDRLINTLDPTGSGYPVNYDISLMSYLLGDTLLDDTTGGGLVIGQGLADDHPIAIKYNPEVASLRDPSTVISSIDLDTPRSRNLGLGVVTEDVVIPVVPGNLWSVRGAISNTATIQDILKTGDFGTGTGNYVQCATCHDPHFKNLTNPESYFISSYLGQDFDPILDDQDAQHMDTRIDGLFLRRVGGNSDSGICRTCHWK